MHNKTVHLEFVPTTSENIIVDCGLLEGAGTYQGGPKPKPNANNDILLKKKKEDMRNGKIFLTKQKDILDQLSSESEIENTPQKVVKRPPKRKSAAAPKLTENPPPEIVRTPRRTRRLNL